MKNILLFVVLILLTVTSELSSQSWQEMMDSCNTYQQAQDYQTALKWALQAEVKAKAEFGEMDTNYVASLQAIEHCFYYLGNSEKAIEYCEKSRQIIKEVKGEESSEYANCVGNLGFLYNAISNFTKAELLYKEALEMRRRLIKGDHLDLATSINNMGVFYKDMGNYKDAELLYNESLEMYRRLFKGDHPDVARGLNNLAYLYNIQDKLSEAGPLYKEALEMYRRLFKDDNFDVAMSLNNLACIYQAQGRLNEAEQLIKEVLEMTRRLFKGDHPDMAVSLNNLACIYQAQGRLNEAEQLIKEVLEMTKRLIKGDNPDVARSLNGLASFYQALGRLGAAEPLLKKALEMYRRLYKGDNPDMATSLNNLALLYQAQGRLSDAEQLFKEALEMSRRLFKGDHPDVATSLNNLAMLYQAQGRLNEAEQLIKEALEMRRRLFKGDNPYVATSLNNLASIYLDQGRLNEAEQIYKEAIEMNRKLFKGDHPNMATSLNNLAYLYNTQDRLSEAEPLYKKALEIYRRLFKGDHPYVARGLNNLAYLYQAQGRLGEAEPLKKEALEMYKNIYLNQSVSLSEKEKEQYWNTMTNIFESFISYAIERKNENTEILNFLYDNQLFTKGLQYNSANKIKKRILESGDSSLIAEFKEMTSKKEMLIKLYSLPTKEVEKQGYSIDSLENIANKLEKELSLKSEDFKQAYEKKKITWKSVQTFLKPDETAVEVVRFQHKDKNRWTDTVYYAFLIVNDETINHPDIVVLENGNELEGEYYNFYRKMIKMKIQDNQSFGRYWGALHEKLKDYKKIYFSADGIYNKINPSALKLPDGTYLIDIQDIQQVNSTKDILLSYYKGKQESSIFNNAVLIGNPNFSLEEGKVKELNQKIYADAGTDKSYEQVSSLRGMELTKLPATETEINNIEKFLKSRSWVVNCFLGDNAVKAAVKSANSPRVLHIATHGLFLEDVKREAKEIFGFDEQRMVENPLLRSGLFFTGADNYLKGDTAIPVEDDNGLLTAYEAMNLNLDKTELVVLSACETGLGDVQNGEGVFGLRRAFQQAGAKTVLMSLWSVNDVATQELMSEFYRNWVTGMTKRDAFAKAQQQIREKYPDPYFWGAFVMVGE